MPEPVGMSFGFSLFSLVAFFPCSQWVSARAVPPPFTVGWAQWVLAVPDLLNGCLVCVSTTVGLSILCTDRVSTEQPFTSATERPLVSVEQAYFLSSY